MWCLKQQRNANVCTCTKYVCGFRATSQEVNKRMPWPGQARLELKGYDINLYFGRPDSFFFAEILLST
jgi:hypothetical protein